MLRRALPPISATTAIHEHSLGSPETPLAASIRHLAMTLSSWALAPSDDRRLQAGWRFAPRGATPVELPRNRTRSARAAQVPPIHGSPRGAPLDVHYPAPLGSDTLCRKLVDRPVGETDPSERSRALTELTLDFSVRHGPAFAKPAASRPALAGPLAKGPTAHVPREGDRSQRNPRCLPSVRSTSEQAADLARRTRQSSQPPRRVDLYPQVVPKLWTRVRASFIPRRAPL